MLRCRLNFDSITSVFHHTQVQINILNLLHNVIFCRRLALVATLLQEGYTAQEIEDALADSFPDGRMLGYHILSDPVSPARSLTANGQLSRGLASGAGPPDHAAGGGPGGPRSGSGSPVAFSDYVPLSGSKYSTRRHGGGSGGSSSHGGERKPSSPNTITDFINVAAGEVEPGDPEWHDVPVRNGAKEFLEAWFASGAAVAIRAQHPAHPPLSAADNPISRPLTLPTAGLPEAIRRGIFAAEKTLSSYKAKIAAAPLEVCDKFSRRQPSDIG